MFTNVSRPSAVDVLRPFAVGDTFYADTTSTLAKLPVGATNDILTIAGGVPVWSSAVVVVSLSVVDSGFFVIGSSDPTKRLNFEVDAQSTGDTLTIDAGAQTDSRTLTVPVLTGNATLMVLSEAQTVTGNKSFTGTVSVVDGSFSIVGSGDSSKTMRFEVDAQTAADDLTINSGAQTDDRTVTFPVLSGNCIFALSDVTLTSGRVPFASTNGVLTDSSFFTWSAGSAGNLTLAPGFVTSRRTQNDSSSRGHIIIERGDGSGNDATFNSAGDGANGVAQFGLTIGGAERFGMFATGSVVMNSGAIATTATDGFLYIPTCPGTPTGTPTDFTGRSPIVIDSTNNKLYFYSGGAWRDAGP